MNLIYNVYFMFLFYATVVLLLLLPSLLLVRVCCCCRCRSLLLLLSLLLFRSSRLLLLLLPRYRFDSLFIEYYCIDSIPLLSIRRFLSFIDHYRTVTLAVRVLLLLLLLPYRGIDFVSFQSIIVRYSSSL